MRKCWTVVIFYSKPDFSLGYRLDRISSVLYDPNPTRETSDLIFLEAFSDVTIVRSWLKSVTVRTNCSDVDLSRYDRSINEYLDILARSGIPVRFEVEAESPYCDGKLRYIRYRDAETIFPRGDVRRELL